jgi:hypothetical protein
MSSISDHADQLATHEATGLDLSLELFASEPELSEDFSTAGHQIVLGNSANLCSHRTCGEDQDNRWEIWTIRRQDRASSRSESCS